MGQSTNDTFPTASHVAIALTAGKLLYAIRDLADSFEKKAREFQDVPKSGRTHLMDATPLSLGAEFCAYASALRRSAGWIRQRRDDLMEVPLGGTAVGTGVNAAEGYRDLAISKLDEMTGVEFRPAEDAFEGLQSRAQMAAFSGSLRDLALELIRIANDLRLMGSGPTAGLDEIHLPAVQPGSSIMPGKVNPVMAECLNMVAFHVVGNDTAVAMASQAGQMDLNVMTPVMTHNILESVEILTNYLPVFRKKCVKGITANEKRCKDNMYLNPALATLLAPKIGYMKAAELAKECQEKGVPVKELAIAKEILTEEEAEELFTVKAVTNCNFDS
jgi:fumarate hydratase class II